ncbi:hypothetical protein ILUMI_09622 [Ignelater luminosus]|uniref:Gamma-interferon-inducible lysosomal thiol reductase n=1 Tax=Ignelater luminosus TaxID=2038154 RepID=A0A8K0D5H2_IGNLU|nr:hypothetical protein ILUMI_09622 [Ignelater luminosus]
MHALKVICCFIAIYMCINAVQGEKVSVTVYYESLCPDSKKFFTSQLYPALINTNISERVNLTLVPYGLSQQVQVDGQWQFTCHHGAYECVGNKIQACAIKKIEEASPTPAGQGFNPITVAFINCLMDKVENVTKPGQDPEYVFPITNCSEINKVRNSAIIENCRNHIDGSNYLAELGVLTQKLQPPLKSVPTIVFNNAYKKEDSTLAQKNFVEALCQYIKDNKPSECKNSATSLSISISVLLLSLLIKQFL